MKALLIALALAGVAASVLVLSVLPAPEALDSNPMLAP